MEKTKKRKRDVELPRITYDAATRTFDRLFKEGSLNELKDVVRKKMNLSSSVPVYLSQLRDGKSVDLDDDDDFEAFSASAYSTSAVKVKVILGGVQPSPLASETEYPQSSSARRRRNKKRKSDAHLTVDFSEDTTTLNNSLKNSSQAKKQQGAFTEGSPDKQRELIVAPKANDKKSPGGDAVFASVDSGQEPLTKAVSNLETENSEPSVDKKSKKRKRPQTPVESNVEEGQTTQPEGGQSTKKKSKKSTNFDGPTADISDLTSNHVLTNQSPDETSQTKRSKKRARTSSLGINDEGESPTVKLPSTETKASEIAADNDDAEHPTKKSKKKHADKEAAAPTVVVIEEPSKTAKPKSKSHPSTSQQSPTEAESAATESAKESKKSRKKKVKVAAEAPDSTTPPAPESSKDASHSKQPTSNLLGKILTVEKLKQPTPSVPSEEPAAEKSEEEVILKKSKKSRQKSDAKEPHGAPETPSAKKSVEPSSQIFEAPQPQPTTASLAETKAKPSATISKKTKKVVKETGPPQEQSTQRDTTVEDNADSSVPPADAKTHKKGSKKKKELADTNEPAATAQEKPSERETNAQNTSKDDTKEITRRAVQTILNRLAEQAKDNQSSSSVVQPKPKPAAAPMQPTPKGKDAQQEPKKSLASSSVVVQPSAPALAPVQSAPKSKSVQHVIKDSTTTAIPSQDKPQSPSICPVCDESPFHIRSKCPIIKAGIKSMRKRIAELQARTSEKGNEQRSEVIVELQGLIEKKTRKPKMSEVAKPISLPQEAPEKEVEAATVSTPANPKSPFTTQPLSIRPSVTQPPPTQPRGQLATAVSVSSSNKAANISLGNIFQGPRKIAEGPLRPDFLGLGDVSLYTEQDLAALIRGPKVTLKDVPSSDTEDESEEEQEVRFEEDEELEIKAPRNASWGKYPSSSDEEEEEEGESPAASVFSDSLRRPGEAEPAQDRDSPVGTEEMNAGNMSFQEVDAEGSSREFDRTGDNAVNDAVALDLAPLNALVLSQETQDGNEKEVDSDTAVASQAGSPDPESNVPATLPLPPPPVEGDFPDPIEPSEGPPASQLEPIVSDDERPMESTPKVEVAVRTRSQRNKTPASTQNKAGDVEEIIQPTRKTRSLTKISELPVPPNPSIRVIRPAPAPRTRRQLAQEEESMETTAVSEETESKVRPRRSTAAATKAAAAKTPAKNPAKVAKTPAKSTTKVSAKTPAKNQEKAATVDDVGDAKTRAKLSVLPADPEAQELNSAKDVPHMKSQEKKGTTNGVSDAENREKSIVSPAELEEVSQGDGTTPPATEGALASWAVLQESVPSQVDTETPGMVDELLSTPSIEPALSPHNRSKQGQKADGSLPEPLFVPAESQQSFPYSQYPDLLPGNQEAAFPNESEDEDDEDEVAKVVRPAASKQTSMFRGLTEIASQPVVYISRISQQFTRGVKEPVQDLYGQSGRESEESDSETDSDAEDRAATSHFPAGRRAGAEKKK